MKRSISTFALLMASVSAVLGSGWLFATLYAAQLAGPASILSWIIGGLLAIFVAFVFAEICAMLPITGSSTRIPLFTHGRLTSFMFSWGIWLSYMAFVPAEVQAVLQYVSYYWPNLVQHSGGLTGQGYIAASILMVLMSFLNVYSLRLLMRCNSALTLLKTLLPILVVGLIFYQVGTSHQTHISLTEHFMPHGWRGVLSAIVTGGILFAFNGFKQACEMAGEAKNPARALPIAVVGSVVVCLLVYVLLQVAFLISMTPANIAQGWYHILIPTENSPFVSVVLQDNLPKLVPLLYAGAILSPLAAALMYVGSSARSLYAMSENKQFPGLFLKVTTQGNPIYAVILNTVLGCLMFAPLPGWNKMIAFLTALMMLTYALGPICMSALRRQVPNQARPFRLPFGGLWSYLAFTVCTVMTYLSGWEIIYKLCIAMAMGLAVFLVYHFTRSAEDRAALPMDARESMWVWPYLAGLALISYLGTFGHGIGILTFGWDILAMAALCIVTLWLAVRFCLPRERTQAYIDDCQLESDA